MLKTNGVESMRRDESFRARALAFARRYAKNRLAIIGFVGVVILFTVAIFAPYLAPYDPAEQDLMRRLQLPSSNHPLGTDEYGRDIFSRIIVGSRVSLTVALAAVAILTVIGVVMGAVAGSNRRLDGIFMRIVDLWMAIPAFFLILAIVAMFGPGIRNTTLVIGFTSWMSTARLVRGQFLSLREKEFVEAARALGCQPHHIVIRHLLPNCFSVIIVQATLYMSMAILLESSLSYLGLGAQPPTPSWGNMLSTGRNWMREGWWLTTFPGLAIFMTIMSINFLGDGLRDALDPRMRD